MKLMNKKVELSINAVTALKKYSHPVRTQDLAVEIGTTVNFLEQIMRNLRVAGIVTSIRGPGGGYILKRLESPLTAYAVAKAVGRDFGEMSLDQAPMNRLSNAVTQAFQETVL